METMDDYKDQIGTPESYTWDVLRKLKEEKTIVHGTIGGIVNAGCIMYVEGVRGFIPVSKLDTKRVEDTNPYLGQEVDAIVITADEQKNKLVLSVRDVLIQKERAERNARIAQQRAERDARLAQLQVGTVLDGVVEKLEDYGAFVKIGEDISGLVHISQIPATKKLKHPSVVMAVGDTVKVKIQKIENKKVSLTMRDLDKPQEPEEKEEVFNYKETGKATTSLASILAGLKF